MQPHLPLQSPRHLLHGLDKKPEVSQMTHKFFWFRFNHRNMSQRQRTSFCFTGHQRGCNEVPALGVINSGEILTLGVKTCTCQRNSKGGIQTLGPKSLQPSLTLILPQDVSLKKKIICPAKKKKNKPHPNNAKQSSSPLFFPSELGSLCPGATLMKTLPKL